MADNLSAVCHLLYICLLQLLLSRPEAKFSFYVKRGHLETELLRDDDGLTCIGAKIVTGLPGQYDTLGKSVIQTECHVIRT